MADTKNFEDDEFTFIITEEEIKALKKSLKVRELEVLALKAQLQDKSLVERESENLKKQLLAKEAEIAQLKSELNAKAAAFTQKIMSLTKEIEGLLQQKEQAVAEVDKKQKNIKDLQQTLEATKCNAAQNTKTLQSKVEQLEKQLSALNDNSSKEKEAFQKFIDKLEGEINDMKSMQQRYKDIILKLEKDAQSLHIVQDQAFMEKSQLLKEKELIEKEKEQYLKENQQLKIETQTNKKYVEEYNHKTEKLSQEIVQLRMSNKQYDNDIQCLINEHEALIAEMANIKKCQAASQMNYTEELQKAMKDKEALQAKVHAYQREQELLSEEYREVVSDRDSLLQERTYLFSKLANQENNNMELTNQLKEAQNSNSQLLLKLKEVEKAKELLQKEQNGSIDDLMSHMELILQENQQINQLRKNVEDMTISLEKSNKNLENTLQENRELKMRLDQQEELSSIFSQQSEKNNFRTLLENLSKYTKKKAEDIQGRISALDYVMEDEVNWDLFKICVEDLNQSLGALKEVGDMLDQSMD